MDKILLSTIDEDQLLSKIEALIDKKLEFFSNSRGSSESTLLTRKEVASFLKISLPTLHDWTKQGLLQSYKIGNRVLYKSKEVEETIKKSILKSYRGGMV